LSIALNGRNNITIKQRETNATTMLSKMISKYSRFMDS